MRTRGWALASLGLLTGGFVAMWVIDADPEMWAGALALAGLALAGLARNRSSRSRPILVGAGLGLAGIGLLLAGFYGLLGAATERAPDMYVEATNEDPVAELDVDETYRRAPELAEALDELVETNASEVLVTEDDDTFQELQGYLVEQTGDYVDPFAWRDAVVRVDAISS